MGVYAPAQKMPVNYVNKRNVQGGIRESTLSLEHCAKQNIAEEGGCCFSWLIHLLSWFLAKWAGHSTKTREQTESIWLVLPYWRESAMVPMLIAGFSGRTENSVRKRISNVSTPTLIISVNSSFRSWQSSSIVWKYWLVAFIWIVIIKFGCRGSHYAKINRTGSVLPDLWRRDAGARRHSKCNRQNWIRDGTKE